MRLHLLHALIPDNMDGLEGAKCEAVMQLCQVQILANDGFRDYHLRLAFVSVPKFEAARSWTGQGNCGSPRKWHGMHPTVRLKNGSRSKRGSKMVCVSCCNRVSSRGVGQVVSDAAIRRQQPPYRFLAARSGTRQSLQDHFSSWMTVKLAGDFVEGAATRRRCC